MSSSIVTDPLVDSGVGASLSRYKIGETCTFRSPDSYSRAPIFATTDEEEELLKSALLKGLKLREVFAAGLHAIFHQRWL